MFQIPANIKMYLYGFLLIVFLGMAGAIWYLNGRVDSLKQDLSSSEEKLKTSKALIAKMIGKEKIDEKVDSFIDSGVAFTAEQHDAIDAELRKAYEEYLLSVRQEEICTKFCEDKFIPNDGKSCPIPKTHNEPNPLEDAIKLKSIDSAWKSYCVANRLEKECQQ